MWPLRILAVIGAVSLLLSFAVAGDTPSVAAPASAPAGAEADEAAVRKCVDQITALFSSKPRGAVDDLRPLLDARFTRVDSFGLMVEGREASLAQYRTDLALLKQRFAAYHETWRPQSVRLFGNVAVVVGRFEMTGVLRKGRQRIRVPFWGTFVLRKAGGQWQFVHVTFVRASQSRPARAADPATTQTEQDP
jgi:hypothetical protein